MRPSFGNACNHRSATERAARSQRLKTGPLIEDDIYGDIRSGEDRPRPFAALSAEADIILCSSLSKTIAPGYRIGWLAANRRHDQILAAKFALSLS
ncbi:aminotransferase class I/II-fold pyridoxal phosphate-dependent enzyme [Bradyrhizobium aeschynomenes]|uniref:aminotransferase class I/II-fold pyridoxal phosphate-dependent enzyme n=1 Tax=Bradyrhizobium aeschynomenes TaxID=2734909 RepID=UPI001FEE58D7|nr:aminotransferase class I/II-fold pyridoxal phosphate-dependent enzyme [Bradyrhizobium aeschynomenes]